MPQSNWSLTVLETVGRRSVTADVGLLVGRDREIDAIELLLTELGRRRRPDHPRGARDRQVRSPERGLAARESARHARENATSSGSYRRSQDSRAEPLNSPPVSRRCRFNA